MNIEDTNVYGLFMNIEETNVYHVIISNYVIIDDY